MLAGQTSGEGSWAPIMSLDLFPGKRSGRESLAERVPAAITHWGGLAEPVVRDSRSGRGAGQPVQTCSALAAVCVADDRGTSSTTPSNLIAHPVSANHLRGQHRGPCPASTKGNRRPKAVGNKDHWGGARPSAYGE